MVRVEVVIATDGVLLVYRDMSIDQASSFVLSQKTGSLKAVLSNKQEIECGFISTENSRKMKKWNNIILTRTQGAMGIAIGEIPLEHVE